MDTTTKIIVNGMAGLAMVGGGIGVTDQAINPYKDVGTQYELTVGSEINPSDKVLIDKDSPMVTLDQWNGESKVSITPEFSNDSAPIDIPASRPLFSKKMQFTQGNETAFVEPSATSSQFNIDITLNSKPISNVFTYQIDGADGLNFFYQPPLTEEFPTSKNCTPTNCVDPVTGSKMDRPENIVGSYAVYSKTKQGHHEGSTNYGTGKLFNIYRPKATDASGHSVWASLNYDSGVLSVTVPQQFLDTAIYPITIDPTFGYTTLGGSGLNNVAIFALGNISVPLTYTATTGDTITNYSIGVSILNGSTDTVDMAAYTFTAGLPDVLVGSPVTFSVTSATPQFLTSSAVSNSLTGGVTYTLAAGNAASSDIRVAFDATGTGIDFRLPKTLTTPWGSGSFSFGEQLSMYATYTNAVSSAPHTQVIQVKGAITQRKGSVIQN